MTDYPVIVDINTKKALALGHGDLRTEVIFDGHEEVRIWIAKRGSYYLRVKKQGNGVFSGSLARTQSMYSDADDCEFGAPYLGGLSSCVAAFPEEAVLEEVLERSRKVSRALGWRESERTMGDGAVFYIQYRKGADFYEAYANQDGDPLLHQTREEVSGQPIPWILAYLRARSARP